MSLSPTYTSTLLGLAIDVSQSMQESINNDSNGTLTRLESIEAALRRVAEATRATLAEDPDAAGTASTDVFAYAFGIRKRGHADLFSLFGVAPPDGWPVSELTSAMERLMSSAERWNLGQWCLFAPNYFKHPREFLALARQLEGNIVDSLKLVWFLNGSNVLKGIGSGMLEPPRMKGAGLMKRVLAGGVRGAVEGAFEKAPPSLGSGGTLMTAWTGGLSAAEKLAKKMVKRELEKTLLDRAAPLDDTTISIEHLSSLLKDKREDVSFESCREWIYGSTPIRAALLDIQARFARERARRDGKARPLLFVISDGESTDGDPTAIVEEIKCSGITVFSCFITNQDVTEPYRLYEAPEAGWSRAAKTMFGFASPVRDFEAVAGALSNSPWRYGAGSRLFVQLNHSTVLSEFLAFGVAR